MKTAYSLVQATPHYRSDAIATGLAKLGYKVEHRSCMDPQPGDLLVIWNRYHEYDEMAKRFEAKRCPVIVLENGYMGREWRGKLWYAAALSHHNGRGRWADGPIERWAEFHSTPKPFKVKSDGYVLVLPQRGIGEPGVAMPLDWPERVLSQLRRLTTREIVVRPHPGKEGIETHTLQQHIDGAWCAVTWASGAGIKAQFAGLPVFHDFNHWIGGLPGFFGAAAIPAFEDIMRNPDLGQSEIDRWNYHRLHMFRTLAWAMCSLDEIESGEALQRLVNVHEYAVAPASCYRGGP